MMIDGSFNIGMLNFTVPVNHAFLAANNNLADFSDLVAVQGVTTIPIDEVDYGNLDSGIEFIVEDILSAESIVVTYTRNTSTILDALGNPLVDGSITLTGLP